MHPLSPLGWDAAWERAFTRHAAAGHEPVRILEVRRDTLLLAAADGELVGVLPGRWRLGESPDMPEPAAGDFAAASRLPGERRVVLRAVLPRRTVLARRFAGRKRLDELRETDHQVVVANADTVIVLSSLNADFSPRRLERFLAQVWEGGAQPAVVLTKADLCADAATRIAAAEAVAPGVPVIAVSAVRGEGLDALAPFFAPGRTAALVGSSGVGKSTLVNALFGRDVRLVREIRAHDDTGQHTTTSRRLVPLPSGGVAIDTPGMRELGLWEATDGVSAAFADVSQLAAACRFRDCSHDTEPGCAVLEAVATGTLDPGRLDGWQHLQRELRFQASKERRAARAALRSAGGRRRSDAPDPDGDADGVEDGDVRSGSRPPDA